MDDTLAVLGPLHTPQRFIFPLAQHEPSPASTAVADAVLRSTLQQAPDDVRMPPTPQQVPFTDDTGPIHPDFTSQMGPEKPLVHAHMSVFRSQKP